MSAFPVSLAALQRHCLECLSSAEGSPDPAHDLLHVHRVVSTAARLASAAGATLEIVVAASWLHDCVPVSKEDPRRSQASRLSAAAAREFLIAKSYAQGFVEAVAHAIEAHSFSAGIPPRTLEAQIVQDADRLDGLGAIGIARCFATAGKLGRAFYQEADPFCSGRDPDDGVYTVDHFYRKLFRTAETMQTDAARQEAQRRVQIMKRFLDDLRAEIS